MYIKNIRLSEYTVKIVYDYYRNRYICIVSNDKNIPNSYGDTEKEALDGIEENIRKYEEKNNGQTKYN